MQTDQAEPKNQAQALIAAHIQALIAQLEAGKSEALTAYLDAMGRFHRYSFGNVLAIAAARPDATHMAGFQAWMQFGRNVKKGERGIRILAPVVVKRKDEAEKTERPQLTGFRSAYVFDVSQTEGKDLPTLESRISGDAGANRDRLFAFIERQGIELFYSDSIAPALGMSYGGKIALLPGQSKAEEFATAVHETAHEMLHKKERRAETGKVIRETEAEAVAFHHVQGCRTESRNFLRRLHPALQRQCRRAHREPLFYPAGFCRHSRSVGASQRRGHRAACRGLLADKFAKRKGGMPAPPTTTTKQQPIQRENRHAFHYH